jgi:hypothetical protein
MKKSEPLFSCGQVADRISAEFGVRLPPWKVSRLFELRLLDEGQRINGRRAIPESMIPRIVEIMRARGWLNAEQFAHA